MFTEDLYIEYTNDKYENCADIVEKVLNGTLKVKEHCLDDWLRSLSYKKLYYVDNFVKFSLFEEEDIEFSKEEEEKIASDLILSIFLLHYLETEEECVLGDDDIIDHLNMLMLSFSLEVMRRKGFVEPKQKALMSDLNTGLYGAGINLKEMGREIED